MRLLDFSDNRTCFQQFRLAEALLYPVMLGRDFLRKQQMILDLQNCVMVWDGIELPMQMRPRLNRGCLDAAVLKEDTDCRAEINVETQAPVPLENIVDGPTLSTEERKSVLLLIEEYAPLFSGKLGTLHKKAPYVLILLPNTAPVACRPFSIPRAYYEATRKEVQRLVKLGVLTPDSSSLWGSPDFVVTKKDGSGRLVCNFRRLNKMLRRYFYPTRAVKETLRSLKEPTSISVFDVPMSYYIRMLALVSRAPTAIVLPWGKFVFIRLPTGVSTAPDEFQACMDEVVGDLDDIMITSKNFEEHLRHLRELFDILLDAGITLHPAKSKICAESVEYLGYPVSTTGIAALPNKVAAIRALAPPKSRRGVRRFVGMINYYRDVLPRRAALLSSPTRLTSPAQPFQRGEREQTAFKAVKEAMTEMVLLAYPRSGRPFHVYTDASKTQLGAVIMQDGKPIVFWSKKYNHAQTAYPANRLELLSILLLLREFRSMLLGQELHIHTDHLNLTHPSFHDIHTMQWRLEIEEYGPIIHYVPGTSNTVADALSRLPMLDSSGLILEERVKEEKIVTQFRLCKTPSPSHAPSSSSTWTW